MGPSHFDANREVAMLSQGDQARGILVVDACGAGQNLHNEQNFSMG